MVRFLYSRLHSWFGFLFGRFTFGSVPQCSITFMVRDPLWSITFGSFPLCSITFVVRFLYGRLHLVRFLSARLHSWFGFLYVRLHLVRFLSGRLHSWFGFLFSLRLVYFGCVSSLVGTHLNQNMASRYFLSLRFLNLS